MAAVPELYGEVLHASSLTRAARLAQTYYHFQPELVAADPTYTKPEYWAGARDAIATIIHGCNAYVADEYPFATPEFGTVHDAIKIAPLKGESKGLRREVPDRNIMCLLYHQGIAVAYILANDTSVDGSAFIDVICAAQGFGKPILQMFLDYCRNINVTLHSLSNVLSFYPKFGFEFGNTCAEAELNKESIGALLQAYTQSGASRTINRDSLQHVYTTVPEVTALLDELKQRGFHHNDDDPVQTSAFAAEGFSMIKCPPLQMVLSPRDKVMQLFGAATNHSLSVKSPMARANAMGTSRQPSQAKKPLSSLTVNFKTKPFSYGDKSNAMRKRKGGTRRYRKRR